MIAVIQRVKNASVRVENQLISEIQMGVLCLLGVEQGDQKENVEKMIQKIAALRIFEDENGKMNLSLKDVEGELLIVSQFTLAASCKKGTRPSFDRAEKPEKAKELYEYAIKFAKENSIKTSGGKFQAYMDVNLTNDGPVTFQLST